MQLGNSRVGKVNANDLPVEMHIDWLRLNEWKELTVKLVVEIS